MAQVSVIINGRKYQVACDDGQEAHLSRLADYVDKRVGELVAAVGQVGDARLLVMATLLVADELSDAYAELEVLKADGANGTERLAAEKSLGATMETLARRIVNVAETLEQSGDAP